MLRNVVLNLEKRTTFNHHENLPNSFRMLIIGSSGSGKTTLLFQMLIESDFIDYNNLIIFTSTPKQQEYQLLYHGFTNGLSKDSVAALTLNQKDFQGIPIEALCKTFSKLHPEKPTITITLSSKTNDIIHPDMLDKTKKHLIIFDDCVNESNQMIMSQYFSRGRHSNCNCIYLSQSYFDLDRTIRLNCNFLILFKLSQRNKVDIYNNIVSTIMEKNKFFTLTDNMWSKRYKYIVINRDENVVYTEIFDEQMKQEKTVDERIDEMKNVNKERSLLRKKFQTHDTAEKEIFEQAAKIQEPTIKAIEKTTETKDTDIKQFPEVKVQNTYKNLQKHATSVSYGLMQTDQTLYVNNLKEEFNVWKFNSNSRGNVGRFILFVHNSKEYIWNKSFVESPVEITAGLNEILFNNLATPNNVQVEDIKKWEKLIVQAGLGSSYKSSKMYKEKLLPIIRPPEVQSEDIQGEGLGVCHKTLIIPSKVGDIQSELTLQLQAAKAGNKDTFNYANALMKELLKNKIITSRAYREILREFYHL